MNRQRSGILLTMAILTMFMIAIILWTLDLVNFIMDTKITLIEQSEDPISAKVNKASISIFHLEAAQNVLYAYMVSILFMPMFIIN